MGLPTGSFFPGSKDFDRFGTSIDISDDGKRVIIGAFTSDSPLHDSGSAQIYQEGSDGKWPRVAIKNFTNNP